MLRLLATGGEVDFEAFWKGVGERRGGEVTFYTFATFLGRVPPGGEAPATAAGAAAGARRRAFAGSVLALPGLLYLVGERFWFEDFEKDNWLLRLIPPKRPFARTEVAFDRSEVTGHRVISRGVAYRCIAGRLPTEVTAPLSRIGRLLSSPAVQLDLKPKASLFFEVMREEELLSLFG